MTKRPGRALACIAAIAGLSLAFGSGCSFLVTDSPPPRHAELPYFDCTSSRWAPNVDLTVAAVYALVALTTFTDSRQQWRDDNLLVSSLLMTGAFGGSAIYGYRHTADCREAKAQLAERLNQAQWDHWNGRPRMLVDPWQAHGAPPGVTPTPAPPGAPVVPDYPPSGAPHPPLAPPPGPSVAPPAATPPEAMRP